MLGGINKKQDKLNLSKKYFRNIKAFVYGKDNEFFNQKLKGKINCKNFNDIKNALKAIIKIIKKRKISS